MSQRVADSGARIDRHEDAEGKEMCEENYNQPGCWDKKEPWNSTSAVVLS